MIRGPDAILFKALVVPPLVITFIEITTFALGVIQYVIEVMMKSLRYVFVVETLITLNELILMLFSFNERHQWIQEGVDIYGYESYL